MQVKRAICLFTTVKKRWKAPLRVKMKTAAHRDGVQFEKILMSIFTERPQRTLGYVFPKKQVKSIILNFILIM